MTHQKQFKKTVRAFAERHQLSYTEALSILTTLRDEAPKQETAVEATSGTSDDFTTLDIESPDFLASAGVYFHGNVGAGKTHALNSYVKQAVQAGWSVVLTSEKSEGSAIGSNLVSRIARDELRAFLRVEGESRRSLGEWEPLLIVIDEGMERFPGEDFELAPFVQSSHEIGIYFAWATHGLGRAPEVMRSRFWDVRCARGRREGFTMKLVSAPYDIYGRFTNGPEEEASPWTVKLGPGLRGSVTHSFEESPTLLISDGAEAARHELLTNVVERFRGEQVWKVKHFSTHEALRPNDESYEHYSEEDFEEQLQELIYLMSSRESARSEARKPYPYLKPKHLSEDLPAILVAIEGLDHLRDDLIDKLNTILSRGRFFGIFVVFSVEKESALTVSQNSSMTSRARLRTEIQPYGMANSSLSLDLLNNLPQDSFILKSGSREEIGAVGGPGA